MDIALQRLSLVRPIYYTQDHSIERNDRREEGHAQTPFPHHSLDPRLLILVVL